jgi:hypothetical protein
VISAAFPYGERRELGRHFLQEDSTDEIGRAIADLMPTTREAAAL